MKQANKLLRLDLILGIFHLTIVHKTILQLRIIQKRKPKLIIGIKKKIQMTIIQILEF